MAEPNTASRVEGEGEDNQVNEVYDQLGCGLFQVFAYLALGFGMSSISWFMYEIGFLIQSPDTYACTYNADFEPTPCTREYICAGDPAIASWEADPDSPKTLFNWQQKLNLTCVDDWKIGMIGASFFLGWTSTLLWLPAIADKNGRKKIFWIGMNCQLLLFIGLMMTTSLEVMIFLWMAFGMLSSVRVTVGYVYLMEMMP